VRLEQLEARDMMAVISVDVRVEGTGVDDQGDPATSEARICSTLFSDVGMTACARRRSQQAAARTPATKVRFDRFTR